MHPTRALASTINVTRPRRASRLFSDAFAGANGALGSFWQYTNSAWTIVSNKAVGAPTSSAELFATTGFNADTDWAKGTGWAIAVGAAAKTVGAASNLTQAVGVVGGWFRVSFDVTAISADGFSAFFGATGQQGQSRIELGTGLISINRAITSTDLGVRATALTIGAIDNLSAKRLTLSDLFASVPNLRNECNISASANIVTDTQAGVAGWLDSYTSPQNFITWAHDGINALLVKCVAGVYTVLISAVTAYSAGAALLLKGHRSGANLLIDAYYNGVQVGTQQTVSDAGIVGNTRHGLFSLHSSNTLGSFAVTAYA